MSGDEAAQRSSQSLLQLERAATIEKQSMIRSISIKTVHTTGPSQLGNAELALVFQRMTLRCALTAVLEGTYTYGTF